MEDHALHNNCKNLNKFLLKLTLAELMNSPAQFSWVIYIYIKGKKNLRFREWIRNLECNRLKREIESANSNSNTWNVWINLRFREWIPQLDITPNDPNCTDASCLLTQSTPQSSRGHAPSAPRFLACSVAQLV